MAEQWFLKIDGIDGESKAASHPDEIDVVSWSWGVTNTAGDGPGGGAGGGAGKATFQDFHFVARISKASPRIFLSCASGAHHKWALLSGVRTAGKAKAATFLKYKLSDVQVTSVDHGDSESAAPTEHFSLNYSKFEVSYSPQTATGKLGPPVSAGFDVGHNKQV